ncbi:hypothetical protein [Kineococcus sp. SYSU DK005]|uniref:hypothetical protein n=1 Tax=Kineococcus sp. SYSU DK005 TaxID=3383126 RepID=UPI003D7C6A5C
MTQLINVLNERAIHAYEVHEASSPAGLRALGAVLSSHGISMNGGLVLGDVENLFFDGRLHAVDDAIEGLAWSGLDDVAALVTRARREYLRVQPTGYEDVCDQDALVSEQINASFLQIAGEQQLEAAISARLADIAPQLRSP